jgi:hypothetical protein
MEASNGVNMKEKQVAAGEYKSRRQKAAKKRRRLCPMNSSGSPVPPEILRQAPHRQ